MCVCVMCVKTGRLVPDRDPACTGDTTKSGSTPVADGYADRFVSSDRYTPHVSQAWTCHLAGVEKMR